MTHIFKHPKHYAEMRKELQAASHKQQATELQAASDKQQATSYKLDHSNWGLPRIIKTQASSGKHQAQSCKPQASSREQQAAQSRYPHKVSSS